LSGVANVVVPIILHLSGTTTPLDILAPVPKLGADIVQMAQGKPVDPKVFIHDLEPFGEAVANYYAPGSGLALKVLFLALEHSRPMTPEEEREWMARFGIQDQW
jgi:hypothetical protein